MVTLNDIIDKIDCLLEESVDLLGEDRSVLIDLKEFLTKNFSSNEDSFQDSYRENRDYIQDLADLFYEYYSLLADNPKDKDCRPKGNNESKSSSNPSREKKLKLAKARAAALRLLSR